MKIIIETPQPQEEDSITLRLHQIDASTLQFISDMRMKQETLIGMQNNELCRLYLYDIYYIESIDNKTFAYCETQVYEIKQKLYQIEETYTYSNFLRISKSCIINISHLSSIAPSLSGRFAAMMDNGEKVSISRQYLPLLKKKISQ